MNGQVTKQLLWLPKAWLFADVNCPVLKIDFCNYLSQRDADTIWRSILNLHDASVQGLYRQWLIGCLSDGRHFFPAGGFLCGHAFADRVIRSRIQTRGLT